MKPHKHAELIKAWADGAEIQQRHLINNIPTNWYEFADDWNCEISEFRIKPEPKPDVVKYGEAGYVKCLDMYKVLNLFQEKNRHHNLKLTFDGGTGELKSAEVLK